MQFYDYKALNAVLTIQYHCSFTGRACMVEIRQIFCSQSPLIRVREHFPRLPLLGKIFGQDIYLRPCNIAIKSLSFRVW